MSSKNTKYTQEYKQTIVNLYPLGKNIFRNTQGIWRIPQRFIQLDKAVLRS